MKSRKLIVLIALIMLLVTPVFAAKVAVTWEWLLADPDVQYFRYQLGGEDPTGWTVVTSDVTYYEESDLDGTQSYTLYLQQSYDGIYWSASASATSEPVVPEVPAVEAPVVVAEEEPVVEVPVEEPVAEVAEVPAEPEPVYGSISVYGYSLSWKFVPGQLDVTYPAFVTDAEAADFIAFTYGRNAKFMDGVYYELLGNGQAVITLPEGASYADVEYVGEIVIGDLFDYISILFAPAAEEAPAPVVEEPAIEQAAAPAPSKEIPVITLPADVALPSEAVVTPAPVAEEVTVPAEEPVMVAEPEPVIEEVVLPVAEVTVEPVMVPAVREKAEHRFVLSLGGGAGVRTTDFKSVNNALKLTLGFGFENMVSFNKTVGLSLQVNMGADLGLRMSYADLFGTPKNIISLSSYTKMLYVEPLLGLTFNTGSVTTHVGAGARFIFRGADPANLLGNWKLSWLNDRQFGATVAPAANLGIRFNFGKVFGLGLDADYAYIINKGGINRHDISGRVTMSFCF